MLRHAYDCSRQCGLLSILDGQMATQGRFRDPLSISKAGRFEGRVEHIASTKATRFYSLDELLAFITRVLREIRDTDEL